MDFQQLSTFCIIVSEKSMTAAAERLKISQPTVSRQIRLLEEELGVQLLNRTERSITPTPQGQLFYEYAHKIIDLSKQAELAVQSVTAQFQGSVHISTMNYLGIPLLVPAVCSFLNPKNEFKVKLSYASSEGVIEQMKRSKTDIAVLPDLQKEYMIDLPNYDKHLLFQDEFVFVGKKKDSSVQKKITLEELTQKPLISFTDMFPNFDLFFKKMLQKNNLEVHPHLESNNLGTLKKVIELGMHYGFLPLSTIQKQVQLGRLCTYKVEGLEYKMDVFLYVSKQFKNKKLIEILILMLQKQISLSSRFY